MVKTGLGSLFATYAVRQMLRENVHGYYFYKTLKSLINPLTIDEFELEKTFYDYFLTKPIYDSHNII